MTVLYKFLIRILTRLRLIASKKAYRAEIEDTWQKVWLSKEKPSDGLYLLYRTNGLCPTLEPILNNHASIILWCN